MATQSYTKKGSSSFPSEETPTSQPWVPVPYASHHPLYGQMAAKSGHVNSLTAHKVKELLGQLKLSARSVDCMYKTVNCTLCLYFHGLLIF